MNKILLLLILITLCLTCISCTKTNNEHQKATYKKISPEAAKTMMEDSSVIILDVRRPDEYEKGHIPNSILIPDYEIEIKAESILTDKNALILVYCRSGRRSKNAASQLVTLGYTNIKEFGGIIDWEYDTITK